MSTPQQKTLGPDEILSLAKSLKSLKAGQLEQIQSVLPGLNGPQLRELHEHLLEVQKQEHQALEHKLELHQKMAAAHEEWKADHAREARQSAEAGSREEDNASAQATVDNL